MSRAQIIMINTAIVIVGLSGCASSKPQQKDVWIPKPRVTWSEIAAAPIAPAAQGFKLLTTEPTQGLFPASMGVTRVAGIGIATGEDEGGDSIGFRLGGQGDVSGTHRLWARRRKMEVGTGIIVDRHFWSADNNGMLRCTEIETGREVLKERLPGGPAWGSMIYAAGRIYITTRSGDTVVLDPDPKEMKVLAVNNLGEKSNATPAISGGEIFLRTNGAITCISKSP